MYSIMFNRGEVVFIRRGGVVWVRSKTHTMGVVLLIFC